MNKKKLLNTWYIATGAAVFLYSAISIWRIIASPDVNYVKYIPDDGYYYLLLAKNFLSNGFWSVDGINATSGFHLLWAYILAAVNFVFKPGDTRFVVEGMTLNFSMAIAAIACIYMYTIKNYSNLNMLLWLSVLISSRKFIHNAISLTEWPLVLFSSFLFIKYFYDVINEGTDEKNCKILFIIVITGTLARSDFVVLPVVLSFVNLLFKRNKKNYTCFIYSISGIAAALLILGIHNYIYTGNLIQSSVLIKAYWERFPTGNELDDSLSLVTSTIGFNFDKTGTKLLVSLVFLTVPSLALIIGWKNKKYISELTGICLVILSYLFLYYKAGSIQLWWNSGLFIPMYFAILFSIRIFEEKYGTATGIIVIPVLTVILFHNIIILNQVDRSYPPWIRNQDALKAGLYLKENKFDGKIASWNSGIIGYYSGGRVINIDGVVNNSIYPYIIKNKLYDYFKNNNIKYIVDFQNMISMGLLRKRGGYNDTRIHLAEVKTFSYSSYWWSSLILWKIRD